MTAKKKASVKRSIAKRTKITYTKRQKQRILRIEKKQELYRKRQARLKKELDKLSRK